MFYRFISKTNIKFFIGNFEITIFICYCNNSSIVEIIISISRSGFSMRNICISSISITISIRGYTTNIYAIISIIAINTIDVIIGSTMIVSITILVYIIFIIIFALSLVFLLVCWFFDFFH